MTREAAIGRILDALDDALDVFAVHGVGGMFAASGTIIFTNEK